MTVSQTIVIGQCFDHKKMTASQTIVIGQCFDHIWCIKPKWIGTFNNWNRNKTREWGTFDLILCLNFHEFDSFLCCCTSPPKKYFFNSSGTVFGILMKPCFELLNFCTYILKSHCPRHTFSCTNYLSQKPSKNCRLKTMGENGPMFAKLTFLFR